MPTKMFFCAALITTLALTGHAWANDDDCEWSSADCLASGAEDAVEGTWAEPYVREATQKLRDYTNDDDSSSDSNNSDDSSDDDWYK